MRVLVDLNVILDVLLDREPHAEASAAVWASIEGGAARGLLAAHAVTTLHYVAARAGGRPFADRCVVDVLKVFEVAPVDGAVVGEALALGWTDFEDAVCASAARASGCNVVVTRDPRGFKGSTVPGMAPREALAAIATSVPR